MKFIPVIFGGYVNAYSIARTFYNEYKMKSVVCDSVQNICYYSNLCDQKMVSDPKVDEKSFIEQMIKLGQDFKEQKVKPIIITTKDEWLISLDRHRDQLEEYFIYSFPHWDVIEKLTIKKYLYAYCDEIGIMYPKTFICDRDNFKQSEIELKMPILIKPSEVVEFISLFPSEKRNIVFEDMGQLKQYLQEKFNKGYKGNFVLQEYIPGGIENLYTITTYSDKNSFNLKGVSIGHKLTQYPKEAGTITSGMICYEERLIEPTNKLLNLCSYYGITNVEYKYDHRDDSYKLIEVNPRPGMWNYSSYLSGVNLFKMMVDDLIYNRQLDYTEGKKDLLWTVIPVKEVLKDLDNKDKKKYVKKLIEQNQVIDPRKNSEDCFAFKFNICKNNLRSKVSKLIKG
ncbi:ATP-grasp domain-containing protein [Hathewaya limosa]|uniref:D-aspartate ligase n=1 Tax=Hathewaya limosa TaxID=1536 RepID=A0ABU0JTT0_HATLI|nr:ATP-grasp domain-containing protein [Hathewaya limosa]MDQ0479636.1 D-aspartate ligase [Hathewaya limosa]